MVLPSLLAAVSRPLRSQAVMRSPDTSQLGQRARPNEPRNPVQVVEHTLASFVALVAEENPLVVALGTDGIELVDGSNGC